MFPATTTVLGIRVRVGAAQTVPGSTVTVLGEVLDVSGQIIASGVQAAVRTIDPAIATARIPVQTGNGRVNIEVTGVSVGGTTLEFTATVAGRQYVATSTVTITDFSVDVDDVRVVVGSTEWVTGRASDGAGQILQSGATGTVNTVDVNIARATIPNQNGTGSFPIRVEGRNVGTTTLTLEVTAGTVTHTDTSTITVFDFNVSVQDASVAPGTRTSVLALVTDDAGQPLPSGVRGAVSTVHPNIARASIPVQTGDGTIAVQVEGVAPGTTTLTFTATVGTRSKQATSTIRVSDFNVRVRDATVAAGSHTDVFGYVTDDTGRTLSSGVTASVTTANAPIATATIPNPSTDGLQSIRIVGHSPGTTTLTFSATVNGRTKQATATITVTDFNVRVADVTVARGSTRSAFAYVTDGSGRTLPSGVTARIRTANPGIATAVLDYNTGDGLISFTVTGVAINNTRVTVEATVGGRTKSASGNVRVTDHSVSVRNVTVSVGNVVRLFAYVTDGAGRTLDSGVTATATTGDRQVATVAVSSTGSGLVDITVMGVTANNTTLTVTATVGGVARQATATITVNP